MTQNEIQELITNNPDFVALKRFDYSLKKLLAKYPDGCPPRVIASALMMTEEEVENTYKIVIIKLRNIMGVNPF